MQLFADKKWVPATRSWVPNFEQLAVLRQLQTAVPAFYRAIEQAYLQFDWVRDFYNFGKPQALIEHQMHAAVRNILPPVMRPDLLITENGFALCELDSVPGGIGQTAALEREFLAGTQIPEYFQKSLAGTRKNVAVVISEESAVYRPEMEYLVAGTSIKVVPAETLRVNEQGVFDAAGTRLDVIYRFFELFDLPNLGDCQKLPLAVERGNVVVLPPMRAFQEEKLSLALLGHPRLADFWQKVVPANDLQLLKKIVPETWILGDACAGTPVLKNLSQKQRAQFVLKASGFSPLAWGAHSVVIGADCSAVEWERALSAIENQNETLYVCQRYCKSCKVEAVGGNGKMARARICPYYFYFDGNAHWAGTLATFCPLDKKIIHGMSVATLTCGNAGTSFLG